MMKTKIFGLLVLFVSYTVFQAYKYEVDSKKFTVSRRIEVRTIASKFYNFVTQAFILEKVYSRLLYNALCCVIFFCRRTLHAHRHNSSPYNFAE